MLGLYLLPSSARSQKAQPSITLSVLANENGREDLMPAFDLRMLFLRAIQSVIGAIIVGKKLWILRGSSHLLHATSS